MEQPDDQTPTPAHADDPTSGGEPTPASADGVGIPAAPGEPGTLHELATVRDLILLAYPDVVPELVRGGTIAELRAAVPPAQAAYRQVAERIASAPTVGTPVTPPAVPAGAAGGSALIDGLPPAELIRRALQRRG